MSDLKSFMHPPVDPRTGKISAGHNRVDLNKIRHCDSPGRWGRPDCSALMLHHDVELHDGDGQPHVTICPDGHRQEQEPINWDRVPDGFEETFERDTQACIAQGYFGLGGPLPPAELLDDPNWVENDPDGLRRVEPGENR